MRAWYSLVDATMKVKTLDAVQSALEHVMDMLRLCRYDNGGIRHLVPHLLLRLGRDQDCYNFITRSPLGQDHTHLGMENADVYEPVDYLCEYPFSYLDRGAVTLMKIRLLLALKHYMASTILYDLKIDTRHAEGNGKLPPELVDQIRSDILQDALVGDLKGRTPELLVEELLVQIDTLYKSVKKASESFWPALTTPWEQMPAQPPYFSVGARADMQLNQQYSFESWRENPEALAFIRSFHAQSEHVKVSTVASNESRCEAGYNWS